MLHRYSDLGGISGILQEVRELIEYPLVHPEVYAHLGIEPVSQRATAFLSSPVEYYAQTGGKIDTDTSAVISTCQCTQSSITYRYMAPALMESPPVLLSPLQAQK